jgi:hypothetical protein
VYFSDLLPAMVTSLMLTGGLWPHTAKVFNVATRVASV